MEKGYRILFLCFIFFQISINMQAQKMRSGHIQKAKSAFNLKQNDLSDAVLTHSHTSKKSGVTHFYYQQTLNGIAIRGANMDIHIKGGKILTINSSFIAKSFSENSQNTHKHQSKNDI